MYFARPRARKEEKIDKGISFKPFPFKILCHEFGNKAKERRKESRGVDTKTFCGEPRVFDTNHFCFTCALL